MEVETNDIFSKAASFVIHTNKPIFLTGKAGTGKTTFLKYIQKNCAKKMVVTAPTGVAAINAGGTTLHSLFHLPFGTYIRDHQLRWDEHDSHIYNRQRLLSKIRLSVERRNLLQELELLVIDEVSMLRADVLDAIDDVLKSVRRDMRPFGGLQLLLIGDLYQLPPVVKNQEWSFLREHYATPFFFDSMGVRELDLVQIELEKIYRQQDPVFIDLLNSIRNNACTTEHIRLLNDHYRADFKPDKDDVFITLCSHNAQADRINRERLKELKGKTIALQALVTGDYAESAYPTEQILQLKIGAQVMFIKNDKGLEKRYYNGKIGFIKDISANKRDMWIAFNDGSEEVKISKEEWKNVKYNYDKAEDKVQEETLGTFSQFPIRLAWAVTIHKSQGLTFDRAIIDAGNAFAAGQVYVALSRVRSLEGLVLRSVINPSNIFTNQSVVDYSRRKLTGNEYDELLRESQRLYLMNLLLETFDWTVIREQATTLKNETGEKNIADKQEAVEFLNALSMACSMHQEVAAKFQGQLNNLLAKSPVALQQVDERTEKATSWFIAKLEKQVLNPLENHIKLWTAKKRTKKYIQQCKALLIDCYRKLDRLKKCRSLSKALLEEMEITDILEQVKDFHSIRIDAELTGEGSSILEGGIINAGGTGSAKSGKAPKGQTKVISLEFFKEGKSIGEIAALRGLSENTITNHLVSFIGTEVQAEQLIDPQKLDRILNYMDKNARQTTSDLKQGLGYDVSYTDIKIAQQVKASTHLQSEPD